MNRPTSAAPVHRIPAANRPSYGGESFRYNLETVPRGDSVRLNGVAAGFASCALVALMAGPSCPRRGPRYGSVKES